MRVFPNSASCRFALVLCALALLLAAPGAGAFAPTRAEQSAATLVPPTPDGQLPLIIETSQPAALAARVLELGGRVQYTYENIDALAVTLPAEGIEALLEDPSIGTVHRQRLVRRAIVPPRLPAQPGTRGAMLRTDGREIVPLREGTGERRVDPIPMDKLAPETGLRESGLSSFLGYDILTGAAAAWEAAGYGEGVIVAIIDTGIFPAHPLYAGNVLGGENLVPPDEEHAIDYNGDGMPDGLAFDWDAIENDPHGTFVAGLVAGHADLVMPEDDPLAQSVALHSPESVTFDGAGLAAVHLMGAAPAAALYGVKVFPYDGSGAPDARVAAAIDRLIRMKRAGILDVDVINMSLSGPVLFDGWNPLDRIVNVATLVGITVVSAASNDGPALTTVGSPGSAFTGLAAGGAVDPIHMRVAIELLAGLDPGLGSLVYPHDDIQVVDFSSRGLTGDRRVKPDLLATGMLVFSSTCVDFSGDGLPDLPSFGFSAGTSFSTPTIAGAAALVQAYAERIGRYARAPFIANALRKGATPIAAFDDYSQREQGRGFVNVPAALAVLESGHVWWPGPWNPAHPHLETLSLGSGSAWGESPDLQPGRTYSFLMDVPSGVTKLLFEFPDVTVSGTQNPFVGDGLKVVVHSAKRGGAGDYFVYEEPVVPGTTCEVMMPEPGTIRVTMMGLMTNWGPVSGSFSVVAESEPIWPEQEFHGSIGRDGVVVHHFEVPAGLEALGVGLYWRHDWTRWPTYDLDLLLDSGEYLLPVASINSPEIALIPNPPAGTWTAQIADIGTVLRREPYDLYVKYFTEMPADEKEITDAPVAVAAAEISGVSPNPCASATEIRFALPQRERVDLRIYDVSGRLVRTLVADVLDAGAHRVRWDGLANSHRRAASGVYFARLDAVSGSAKHKIVLLQ